VAACNFYADPSHRQPIFPETIEFILKHKGFADVQLEYLNPVEQSPFRNDNPGSQELDSWFFGPRDFAVIARKQGGRSTLAEEVQTRHVLEVAVEDKTEIINLERCVTQSGHAFYARPQTDDREIFEAVVEKEEYPLPQKFGDEDVLIDIGAHIGSFSYAVLERGAARVYAYEAHPVNHAITRKNLERFGTRAQCRNLAVWRSDVPSQTLFNDRLNNQSGPNTGGHAVVYNNDGLPIQTVGLDDILREATDGFRGRIRLLKIDCEGAEYPILFSAKHLNVIEEICGEYHEIDPEVVPLRARVKGMPKKLDRHALKNFLEREGWMVEIHPVSEDGRLGHFRARPKKSFPGFGDPTSQTSQ
jgi:FkbM family methyltransferase